MCVLSGFRHHLSGALAESVKFFQYSGHFARDVLLLKIIGNFENRNANREIALQLVV
jgi:hypothetical protein